MKISWPKIATPLAVVAVIAHGFVACGDAEKKKSHNAAISDNVKKVQENFVPGSLKLDNTALHLSGDDPCAGLDFFSCQPKLLKIYIAMAESSVKLVANFAKPINDYIGTKEDDSSGEDAITPKEAGDVNKIKYKKVNGEDYKVIMAVDDKPVVLIGVKKEGDAFKYDFDFMMMHTKEFNNDGFEMKKFRGTVTFNGEDDFDVDFKIGDLNKCNPDDAGAPDFIAINVIKKDGVWKGKSMMRSPRLLVNNRTCDTPITATSKMFTYTDFVADKDKATASLYLAKSTLTAVTGLSGFNTQSYCSNFPCVDGNKFKTGDPVVASTYQSPYCANTTANTLNWNTACTDLPVTNYSPDSRWLMPEAMDTQIEELTKFEGPTL